MINKLFLVVLCFYFLGCSSEILNIDDETVEIECTEKSCIGTYSGVEFIGNSDVAHQFSNRMSEVVGDKLKQLYNTGNYSKVDFSNVIMTTKGMGSGNVVYKLTIPFKTVNEKCQAFTSFDHVGGWDHEPALSSRKAQLQSALLKGEQLDISELKQTAEGLQEYWIQWKNKTIQVDCENISR